MGEAAWALGLEPERLWSAFSFVCSVPHPSRREGALAAAIVERERALGIEASLDRAGNVLLRRPASPGREGGRGLILQAHLDMVPQAVPGSAHDFARDPIRPRIEASEPGWLRASGTTLGADNGIGLAAALALIESEGLARGELECLFTANEEDGMDGARGLEPGSLRGSLLVNLDSESADEICIGCAGGSRMDLSLPLAASALPASGLSALELSLGGLRGGHSGVDIQLGRGNAIRLLARILRAAGAAAAGARLAAFEGGSAANAIPRGARALVLLPPASRPAWEAALSAELGSAAAELGEADPGLRLELAPVPGAAPGASPAAALEPGSTNLLLDLVLSLPNGVFSMSEATPGIARSSSSLGVARLSAGAGEGAPFSLELSCAPRSEDDAEKEATLAAIEGLASRSGGLARRVSQSPAWTPDPASPLLALARSAYRELNGRDCAIGATHGGLETALFRTSFPAWDMISIGPTIRFPHSPDEAVEIESVGRFWRLLTAIAARA
ncbi:MAG TPA: beta-Ala-His dipeptidase [Spirochaetia bacterium]|nr:beta-Ala-His dipeptidase [Spirochaetia bacterium]HRZ63315.1 beta-Ala-His dipeptidase [Spirochaetia bacterium]